MNVTYENFTGENMSVKLDEYDSPIKKKFKNVSLTANSLIGKRGREEAKMGGVENERRYRRKIEKREVKGVRRRVRERKRKERLRKWKKKKKERAREKTKEDRIRKKRECGYGERVRKRKETIRKKKRDERKYIYTRNFGRKKKTKLT